MFLSLLNSVIYYIFLFYSAVCVLSVGFIFLTYTYTHFGVLWLRFNSLWLDAIRLKLVLRSYVVLDFCVYYVTVLWFTHLVSFLNVINCCYLATMCLSFEVFLQYEGVVGLSIHSSENSSSPQEPQQPDTNPKSSHAYLMLTPCRYLLPGY